MALAVDVLVASDDARTIVPAPFPLRFRTEVDTLEIGLGVRKFWGEDTFRPYVGGGVAWVRLKALQVQSGDFGVPGSEFSDVVIDDKGSGVGLWAGGGFVYRWGDHLNLGLDVRYSDASVSLRPRSTPEVLDLDSGGVQYGVVVGYHW